MAVTKPNYTTEPQRYWAYGQSPGALAHVVVAHSLPNHHSQRGACGTQFIQSNAPQQTPAEAFRCAFCDRYARKHDIRGEWDRHDEFDWERGY